VDVKYVSLFLKFLNLYFVAGDTSLLFIKLKRICEGKFYIIQNML